LIPSKKNISVQNFNFLTSSNNYFSVSLHYPTVTIYQILLHLNKNSTNLNKKNSYPAIQLLLFSILLIAVSLPRFNRTDHGFSNLTGGSNDRFIADDGAVYEHLSDARCYLELVKYFRNYDHASRNLLTPPFCYRPLPSLIASIFPFNEMTSLNILNILFLIGALLIIERILSKLDISNKSKYSALFLFVVSFPTFYYGTIGYIDPAFIFFLSLGFYFFLQERSIPLVITVLIGTFAKEGIAILLPVVLIRLIEKKFERKTLITIISCFIAFVAATVAVRTLFNSGDQYVWVPNREYILYNLGRLRTPFSISVTFGIPGILALLYLVESFKNNYFKQLPYFWYFTTGFVFSILFCLFGVVSVSSDGRYVWPVYIFTIPLSALFLDKHFFKK
jgi:hypothetical protein